MNCACVRQWDWAEIKRFLEQITRSITVGQFEFEAEQSLAEERDRKEGDITIGIAAVERKRGVSRKQ